MAALMASSLFATTSIHNAASRYLFTHGRQRRRTQKLSRIHHRHGSPHVAKPAVSIVTTAVVALAVGNLGLLSGASNHWMNSLPTLLAVGFAIGVGYALRSRSGALLSTYR